MVHGVISVSYYDLLKGDAETICGARNLDRIAGPARIAGSKYPTYFAIASAVSRSGSTVMKIVLRPFESSPRASSHPEISESVVGHISGQ